MTTTSPRTQGLAARAALACLAFLTRKRYETTVLLAALHLPMAIPLLQTRPFQHLQQSDENGERMLVQRLQALASMGRRAQVGTAANRCLTLTTAITARTSHG